MRLATLAVLLAALAQGALAQGDRQVAPARAAALFDAVCGKTLPSYRSAAAALQANGFTRPSPTGTPTIYSVTEDASFQIVDDRCSFVFASTGSKNAVRKALAAIAGRPLANDAAGYRDKDALIQLSGPSRNGGRSYYRVLMVALN